MDIETTLTTDQHRMLLDAALVQYDGIYDSDINSDSDMRIAEGLAEKGLVRIDLGLGMVTIAPRGMDWLWEHAGTDDCLPNAGNPFWQRLLSGDDTLDLSHDDLCSDEYEELVLLGIVERQGSSVIITDHGRQMRMLDPEYRALRLR